MKSALAVAHGGVATPWNSGLFRVVARHAWMHKCHEHMDVQERLLPCTTISVRFTPSN
ncbi:MAG: hypothetical protein P8179_15475 [Candidatus Thiodiazotropha sp.]